MDVSPRFARAMCTASVRMTLGALATSGVSLQDCMLRFEVSPTTTDAEVQQILDRVIAAVPALSCEDVDARLMTIVRTDPLPNVRGRSLLTLRDSADHATDLAREHVGTRVLESLQGDVHEVACAAVLLVAEPAAAAVGPLRACRAALSASAAWLEPALTWAEARCVDVAGGNATGRLSMSDDQSGGISTT